MLSLDDFCSSWRFEDTRIGLTIRILHDGWALDIPLAMMFVRSASFGNMLRISDPIHDRSSLTASNAMTLLFPRGTDPSCHRHASAAQILFPRPQSPPSSFLSIVSIINPFNAFHLPSTFPLASPTPCSPPPPNIRAILTPNLSFSAFPSFSLRFALPGRLPRLFNRIFFVSPSPGRFPSRPPLLASCVGRFSAAGSASPSDVRSVTNFFAGRRRFAGLDDGCDLLMRERRAECLMVRLSRFEERPRREVDIEVDGLRIEEE